MDRGSIGPCYRGLCRAYRRNLRMVLTMKYALYEVVDNRDGKPMLWLHDRSNHRVALFFVKTAPSRIKRRTAAAPEGITWEPDTTMIVHAKMGEAVHIDSWEFNG